MAAGGWEEAKAAREAEKEEAAPLEGMVALKEAEATGGVDKGTATAVVAMVVVAMVVVATGVVALGEAVMAEPWAAGGSLELSHAQSA